MSSEKTSERSTSVLLGAAFLMATSAIGPGFLTQTSQFTAKYLASFAFVIVCILTWGNLRGMRESAIMFGVPTYFLIFAILALIVTGFVRVLVFG